MHSAPEVTRSPSEELLPRQQPWKRSVRALFRRKTAAVGALAVVCLLFIAAIGPYVAPYDPFVQDLRKQHQGPTEEHLLGTDQLGRDLLSRMLYGARLSLTLSFSAVALGLLLGVPVGLVTGYYGGAIDHVVMRIVDVLLAFPTSLLAIFLVAVTGPSFANITIAVGVSRFPATVRITRAGTLGMRNGSIVEAARSLGASTGRIMFKHILPNIYSPVLIGATMGLGTAILTESSLSFLGIGLTPPTPAWGLMIQEGVQYTARNAWLAILPGIAIMVTVLGFNLFGDGLRDALDPRLRHES